VLILAIETSTARSSVALVGRDGVVASAGLGVPARHGEFVTPAAQFCLAHAGATVDDVTGVAVGLGPGLYTGLRVGIATAQAFAAARGLPMVGLSGLDVLAFQARHVRRAVVATLDARRGEIFWAVYRPAPGGVQRDGGLRVGRPDELSADLESMGEEVLVIGDGAARYRDQLDDLHLVDVAVDGRAQPDAADLGTLAVPRFVREETSRAGTLAPLYLRHADAKIGWEQRGRLRGGGA
jgi:tRNA threonylcarbamoyladenosine biosynthesis protein TsaB